MIRKPLLPAVGAMSAALILGAGLATGGADANTAGSAESLQVLLEAYSDQYDAPYHMVSDGLYGMSLGPGAAVLLAERTVFREQGADVKTVYLFSQLTELPTGAARNENLLARMAEINDKTQVGWLSLNGDKVFYNSSFWLDKADVQVLRGELSYCYHAKELVRQLLEALEM